jgi:hypothetical protein
MHGIFWHCSALHMADRRAAARIMSAAHDMVPDQRHYFPYYVPALHALCLSCKLLTSRMHADSSIAQQVIGSSFFGEARSVGLYITCERLREVDTMALLTAALQQGDW